MDYKETGVNAKLIFLSSMIILLSIYLSFTTASKEISSFSVFSGIIRNAKSKGTIKTLNHQSSIGEFSFDLIPFCVSNSEMPISIHGMTAPSKHLITVDRLLVILNLSPPPLFLGGGRG